MTDVAKRIEASRERIKRERPAVEPLRSITEPDVLLVNGEPVRVGRDYCGCQDCRRERDQ